MNAHTLTYAFESPPEPGQVLEAAPGILWIRMPLPFALDHVNLWVLDDGDGWCLIDTGFPDDTIKELWQGLLAGPLAGRPVTRILATHMHPDHIGLAGWLQDLCGGDFLATQAEWLASRMLWLDDSEGLLRAYEDFYRRLAPTTATPLLGLPGLAAPMGMERSRPVGVQLISGRFREDVLLSAGAVLERANGPVVPVTPRSG